MQAAARQPRIYFYYVAGHAGAITVVDIGGGVSEADVHTGERVWSCFHDIRRPQDQLCLLVRAEIGYLRKRLAYKQEEHREPVKQALAKAYRHEWQPSGLSQNARAIGHFIVTIATQPFAE
ncbi:hypothetical protein Tco_1144526 [Tanacetum coccineum]